MGEVKGQGHIVDQVSTLCMSFSFHFDQTNNYWHMAKRVFDLEKTPLNNFSKIYQKYCLQHHFPNIFSGYTGNMAIKSCSDWMCGSSYFMQTSKFVFITATVMTLDKGHGNVNPYNFPDLDFLCSKYRRWSSNGFDMRSKNCVSGGCRGSGGSRHKL